MSRLLKNNWGLFLIGLCYLGTIAPMNRGARLDTSEIVELKNEIVVNVDLSGRSYTDVTGIETIVTHSPATTMISASIAADALIPIYKLDALKLDLSNNQLSSLPIQITSLKNLKRLTLDNNNFKQITTPLTLLTYLKWLSLESNKLECINPTINQLTNLVGLYLGHNRLIKSIPCLSSLIDLNWLYLNDLCINTIPDAQNLPPALCELNLSGNLIRNMIPCCVRMQPYLTLTDLTLSSNSIETIPSEISYLSALESLDLTNNEICEIPDTIGTLKKLSWLRLNNNKIQKLPESIATLKRHVHIQLLDNNLESPAEIKARSLLLFNYLTYLHEIGFLWYGNPLKQFRILPKPILKMIYYLTLQ